MLWVIEATTTPRPKKDKEKPINVSLKFFNFKSIANVDIKKLELTINNLKDSDRSIKFYVDRNLNKNSKLLNKDKTYILNKFSFDQSHEVIFRSLTKIIQIIGRKYYPVRGKSIDEVINAIKQKSFTKLTLGGCIIERINETILISRESVHKVWIM